MPGKNHLFISGIFEIIDSRQVRIECANISKRWNLPIFYLNLNLAHDDRIINDTPFKERKARANFRFDVTKNGNCLIKFMAERVT